MNHKILVLTVLFSFIATFAYSQKCKYEYQKTDELTGLATKAVFHEVSSALNLRFKAVDGGYSMDVLIYFSGFNMGSANTKIPLEADDFISFKFSTGEIVRIPVPKQIIPDLRQDKLALFHLYENIPVDKELLEKLSGATISYVCLCNEKKIAEGTLKEKDAKILQEKLICILQ